jgi:hypothetical protein
MTNDEVNEALLLLLRLTRSHEQALGELTAQVQAIYDYLDKRDKKFHEVFSKSESESSAEVSLPITLTLRKLDDIIRRLEAGRKLTGQN